MVKFPPSKVKGKVSSQCLSESEFEPSLLDSALLCMFCLYGDAGHYVVIISCKDSAGNGQLYEGFYHESCPQAEAVVKSVMKKAIERNPRNAASVLRLQYHDCLVNGCDGSVLLDDTPTMAGEKNALSNINSLRAFEVIDEIKEALEQVCPNTVSCADIIIIAARDAVVLTGGPSWEVLLGRRDSLTASLDDSNDIMPSPRANVTAMVKLFERFGLSVMDLVALSGSHSIGEARCFSVVFRLYNQSGSGKADPTIQWEYKEYLEKICPQGGDGNVTAGLDATPTVFDNRYFKDLVKGRGFLNSDEVLFSTHGETRHLVELFSRDQSAFFANFTASMITLGNLLSSHTSHCGEIRRNCRKVN
eukprot:Gb_40162 [translate_table: standard]